MTFKNTMSIDELRQRNEQSQQAATQKPQEQPQPTPKK